ncbi:hypothetical protein GS18_0208045 [Metabacillus indicus]|uniref:Uncharacterized protein n=1 Tax=Metabacillus indicus TaxID=246786 RepID=A0A084H0X3_METID|nr:hypothetical protein GS18_0208045 [Metabacillus indicus]
MIIGKAELKGSAFLIVQLRLLVLLSEQNPPKSQNRTFRRISYLTARPEQSAPLFLFIRLIRLLFPRVAAALVLAVVFVFLLFLLQAVHEV